MLNEVRKRGRASVDELVRLTGKSQPTILKWLSALERDGYLRRNGFGESTGGRPPALYEFAQRRGAVLGLAVEIPYVKASLLDLHGHPFASAGWILTPARSENAILDELLERVASFLESDGVPKDAIVGGGIAFSGFIDQQSGVSLATPRLPDWRDVPVRSHFEDRFGIPFVLNHHIDALTLAEMAYGAARGWRDFLFFDVGYGLGIRVVKEASPVFGAFGNAGLIGHTTVVPDGRMCICGNRGCLEEYVSGRALLRRGAAVAPPLVERGRDEIYDFAARIFAGWRAGDAEATRIVDEMTDYLAIGLANAVNVFDLPKVVLSGFVTLGGTALREALLRRSSHRLQTTHAAAAELVFATGPRPASAPLGAALFALRHHFPFLDPLVVATPEEGGQGIPTASLLQKASR